MNDAPETATQCRPPNEELGAESCSPFIVPPFSHPPPIAISYVWWSWHPCYPHENGSYYCKCLDCDADFVGHKRRHICRKCHYEAKARYDALTPVERAACDEKRNAEIRSYFSQTNDERSAPAANEKQK
jgi:hypothetical protein